MNKLTLQAILSPSVYTVAPETSLSDVLAGMESQRISCVVAVDDAQRPVGIFTEQDAIRLMAERRAVARLRMSDVMSTSPLTALSSVDFRDAYRLISEKGFRHLIVVNDAQQVIGVVSEGDFLQHIGVEYLVGIKTVSNAMTRELISLQEDSTLADAVDLMSKNKISCVVITRDNKPVGILTERDAAGLARTVSDPTGVSIVKVMKAPVQTIEASLPMPEAMALMELSGIRRLVVVEGDTLAGIVTRHDIVKTMQGRYIEFLHDTLEHQREDLHLARRQIEQTRQQLLYHSLMEQVNDAIVVLRAESGAIVDCNEQACRDLGYTRDELLHLSIFDFTTRMVAGPLWQAELEIFNREGQRLTETKHRRRDGTLFPVEIHARLIRKDQERYIVAVARDLSERKRTQTQLHLQDTALNSTANAIVITDRDAVIQWANPAFAEMTGYTPEEAIGKYPKDLVSSGIQTREFYDALWKTIRSGQVWRGELVNRRKDGTLYTEEMTITPVYTESNTLTHFIAIKQNVSERKLHEQMQAARNAMLEKIATNQPLRDILLDAILQLEELFPAMRASVLQVDMETGCLGQGIAPRLPAFYNDAINGVHPGPGVGSCGTAAHTGETVIVEDIQTHEYWRDYRELAQRAGLAACTSVPFMNEAGAVLGTFAVYYPVPHLPSPVELELVVDFARMTGIAVDKEHNKIKRAKAEALLRTSEANYRNLVESAPFPVVITDAENKTLVFTNRPALQLFESTAEQSKERKVVSFYANPSNREKIIARLEAGEVVRGEEVEFITATGKHIWTLMTAANIAFDGRPSHVAALVDVTLRKKAEEQLREAAAVMQNTHEGVVITDTTPRILAVNDAYTAITGYTREEVLGKDPSLLNSGRQDHSFYESMWDELSKNGYWQGEMWNRRKNGETYPQWMSISAVLDERRQPIRYIGVFSDISRLKESQSQLEFMAHHDPLTRLFNRSAVESRMEQELEQAERHQQQLSVLFIDLDRFKQVNDSFGHLIGDELLCNVAGRLRARLREGDTLGRLGGDEFVLLATPLQEKHDAAVIARDIIASLNEPFNLSTGHEVFIGASIGISLYPDNGSSVAELTRNADAAMYLAKENGRNQFSFYTPELNADARNKLEMENDLRRAVMHNELRLHYQAKVDIASGSILGAEALVRWKKPDGTWVSPGEFIPIAEKSGVILTIGNWVIEQACVQIRDWMDAGLPGICVAVNVSARQFRSGHLDKLVKEALEKYAVAPHQLELELTESMLMHEPERAIDTMHKLKKVGVKLSLDDFGTGYSNFGYLRRFPIDSLKIDQSFVRGVATRAEDAMIVDSIIGLAQRMKLHVIAEGVETADQLHYLRANHCDEIQGYYFSKPLPADEFARLLRSGKKLAE
ncbi:MAG: EAL domain-containing protein [Sideroxyarcus sp.]|nr:EAL domain-containing protein [Sideroxyarcus sp.]